MTKMTATPALRSMATRAAHLGGCCTNTLITEIFAGTCVQATGKMVRRNTRDGVQWTVQVNWWINTKRASRKEVYKRFGQAVKGVAP